MIYQQMDVVVAAGQVRRWTFQNMTYDQPVTIPCWTQDFDTCQCDRLGTLWPGPLVVVLCEKSELECKRAAIQQCLDNQFLIVPGKMSNIASVIPSPPLKMGQIARCSDTL